MLRISPCFGAGVAGAGGSAELVIERSLVRFPAGAAGDLFPLQDQSTVLTLISVSVPPPCYRSSMQKIPVILPNMQLQLNSDAPYVYGFT